MQINKVLTQQSLKDISKYLNETAKILGEEATGLECKKISVSKINNEQGAFEIDISIKLTLLTDDPVEIANIINTALK